MYIYPSLNFERLTLHKSSKPNMINKGLHELVLFMSSMLLITQHNHTHTHTHTHMQGHIKHPMSAKKSLKLLDMISKDFPALCS